MSKGTEMIDEKLTELYAQLETLGSIKEKTAAIKDIAAKLSSIGDERVRQVENALSEFSQKTNGVVSEVDGCIDKLNRVLTDIKQTPLIEELRGIRTSVSSNIKAVGDGVTLVERKLTDRIGVLSQEIDELAGSLSRNSTEVTTIKRNVGTYATQTKEGLAELDTTVRDRTGQLDTKLDVGQSQQSSDIREMGKSIVNDIGGSRKAITDAVIGCKEAVAVCQNSVKSVRTLVIVTLIALVGLMIATFPLVKVAWVRYFR